MKPFALPFSFLSIVLLSACARGIPAPHDVPPTRIFDALSREIKTYPMLDFVGWQPEWEKEFREKIAAAPDAGAAMWLMDEYVCRLNDYHTRLFWPAKSSLENPPIRVEPVAVGPQHDGFGIWGQLRPPVEMPGLPGIAIAVTEAAPSIGLQPGDEIISIDGKPCFEALAETWKHAVGSSVAAKLRSAAGRMLLGEKNTYLSLEVRRRGNVQSFAVKRTGRITPARISSSRQQNVPVIRITHWSNPDNGNFVSEFDVLLERHRQSPMLIIDVRGNGGGQGSLADAVIGRFIGKPVLTSFSFRPEKPALFRMHVLKTEPRGWRYTGRVAVLTDEGCMSSSGHFVSGMIEAGALACGTPVTGACGLIRRVGLPGNARLNIARTFPIHTGGIPSPMIGIAPHIWAPRKLEDLIQGKDTALEAALICLRSSEPLPPRLQPIPTFNNATRIE